MDADPKLLDDTVIVQLLGPEILERLHQQPERYQTREALGLRSHVLLRSRYAEDRLAEAVRRGVRQFVSLGAGFDTFAYRQPAWARECQPELRIFEVDQIASQRAKRDRLAAAGIAVPPNVTFVEADFEHMSLHDMLVGGGFSTSAPAFISWLGVTVYLTEAAIDAVLQFVGTLPASSEIVFTFHTRERAIEGSALAARAAEVGEPFISYFTPEEIEHKLRGFGFSEVSFLTPQEAERRYFPAPRSDRLPAPVRINTVSGIV
jgi:methyltransferase (TIGR00027 family)